MVARQGSAAGVSSHGRFRSTRGVITTPKPRAHGYVEVGIYGKTYRLHRLVAAAFRLPQADGQTQVNHINGNPSGNTLSNLEWSSRSENILHSYRTNTTRGSCAPRKSKPIRGAKVGTKAWTDYPNANDASRVLGIHRANIVKCLRCKRKQTNGYTFEYSTPTEPPLLEGEVWKTYGAWRVSSVGRVQNSHGVIFTPKPRRDGYICVMVGSQKWLLHRLVMTAFEVPCLSEAHVEVNHINGNPSDNTLANLERCTKKENVQHSYATNTLRTSSAKRQMKRVRGRKVGTEAWTEYAGLKEAARTLGLGAGKVTLCCQGKRGFTQGYEFEYCDDDLIEGEVWKDVGDDVLRELGE